MKGPFLVVVVYLLHQGALVETHGSAAELVNNRPIIGVLSQEQPYFLYIEYPEENYTSYIASSYVKGVESAGARVVPIMIGKERSYYKDILGKINGVLFPGGNTTFNQSKGYADAGQHIFELAQELNDAGDYFPIFGTCLGFQLIIVLASGRGKTDNTSPCYSNENLPLQFTNDFNTSKMFAKAEADIVDLLATENVTVNRHQFCVTDDNLEAYNLTDDWRATSYGDDKYGVRFIASYEHTRYPFYGTQFHPEKYFEWGTSLNYPHFKNAVKANRHFMDFFVDECRQSNHTFMDDDEENEYVIYKYEPKFTGMLLGTAFEQCYMFEPRYRLRVSKNKN